jgi:voltage-gated potassium channel
MPHVRQVGPTPDRMTGPRYTDLAPVHRRRLLLASLARSTLTATLLVVVYYLAPLDRRLTAKTAWWLAAGLLAFVAVTVVQIRAVVRSAHPRLRAIESLSTAVPMFLLVFAAAYDVLGANQPHSFTQPLTRTDALYFTVTVFATVGFGDIAPRTETARVVTTVQMVLDLLVLGVIVRVILGAVEVALRRRR